MEHHCHALNCRRKCPPEYLMCGTHWRKVPKELQAPVWRHYRTGQCDDKKPSIEWCKAADAAVAAVATQESVTPAIIHRGTVTHGFLASFHPEAMQGGT